MADFAMLFTLLLLKRWGLSLLHERHDGMGLYDFTFYDLINRNAQIFRDLPAWYEVDEDRTLSFGEYKATVDRLAQGLRKAGIKKGDRLGVLGKNSTAFFLLYGAAAGSGRHRFTGQLAAVGRRGLLQPQ